ncbi:MAG: HEAT repeat domain-containing protein, partial [Planctomycetota bacterium]
GEETTMMHIAFNDNPRGKIVFDTRTGKATSTVILKRGVPHVMVPSYETTRDGWRLESRKWIVPPVEGEGDQEKVTSYHYHDFQGVNRYTLPARLVVTDETGSTDFFVEYLYINREPAIVGEEGLAKVRNKINYLEENYGQKPEFRRLIMMKKLASTGHELAAECILKKCLTDESALVRTETIQILGQMGCRNIAPALGDALIERKMDPELYLLYIETIGNIGSPDSVDALCTDFHLGWDKKTDPAAASARITALGKIRSCRSVEALIRILQEKEPEGNQTLHDEAREALESLTGKAFDNLEAWQDWWKRQKADYKLADDE